jgi:hypothetical protein
MEDIFVYQRPYDSLRPVVCIDETNKQLIKQTRLPCVPGHPTKVDYEYERMGVVDVFMIFEPLGGRREILVTVTPQIYPIDICRKIFKMCKCAKLHLIRKITN